MGSPRTLPLASAFLVAALSACAPLDFASHESFDAWYVSKDRTLPAERLGFRSLDGNIAGYVVNDVAIRTPLAYAREAAYLLLTPIALPYYGARFVFGSGGGI